MKLSKNDIKKIQDYFASQKDVVAVYLYGSFAYGNPHKRSDIDFGVLFDSPIKTYYRLGEIINDLSDLDLHVEADVRDISLDQSPLFLFNVIRGKLIFSKDEDKRLDFEIKAMNNFYDTEYSRQLSNSYMKLRIKEGKYGYRLL